MRQLQAEIDLARQDIARLERALTDAGDQLHAVVLTDEALEAALGTIDSGMTFGHARDRYLRSEAAYRKRGQWS